MDGPQYTQWSSVWMKVASPGASLYCWSELKTNRQPSVKNSLKLYIPNVYFPSALHSIKQHFHIIADNLTYFFIITSEYNISSFVKEDDLCVMNSQGLRWALISTLGLQRRVFLWDSVWIYHQVVSVFADPRCRSLSKVFAFWHPQSVGWSFFLR